MSQQSLASRATKPMVLTKLMLVGRRDAARRANAPRRRPAVRGRDVPGNRRRRSSRDGSSRKEGDGGPGPVIAFVHGWLWNRLGNVEGRVRSQDRGVDFLSATKALHDAGYHVLLLDVRHHGESGRGPGPRSPTVPADARLHRSRRTTCVGGRTSTASASARSARGWAATSSS